jgi:integrase
MRTTPKARARARAFHLLPLRFEQLTTGDLREIDDALTRQIEQLETELGGAALSWTSVCEPLVNWETAFAVTTILHTGCRLADLYSLRVYQSPEILNSQERREGFFLEDGGLFLQLAPRRPEVAFKRWKERKKKAAKLEKERGRSSKQATSSEGISRRKKGRAQKAPKDAALSADVSSGLTKSSNSPWAVTRFEPSSFEVSDPHRLELDPGELALRLINLRPPPKVSGDLLFTTPKEELWARIEFWLRDRRPEHAPLPRRVSRNVESLERRGRQQLIEHHKGDPVSAARQTGRFEGIHSGKYYGTSSFPGRDTLGRAITVRLGAEKVCDEDAIRHVVTVLKERVRANPDSFEALANYTAFMVSFALGHRGHFDFLPSTSAIDHETGFCVIHDKNTHDPARARLVWVPDAVQAQIRAYESEIGTRMYLETDDAARDLWDNALKGRLTFPHGRSGAVATKLQAVISAAIESTKPPSRVPVNVGRHWLRTKLSGRCASITVDAFLGHWHEGAEPWAHGSCLDPIAYRADLERSLSGELSKLGFECVESLRTNIMADERPALTLNLDRRRAGHATNSFCSLLTCLESDKGVGPTPSEIRAELTTFPGLISAGKLVASAVFNGAFLRFESLDSLLTGMSRYLEGHSTHWITTRQPAHEAGGTSKVRRWIADETTRRHIVAWRMAGKPGAENGALPALRQWLTETFGEYVSTENFFELATAYWSFRLPPLLLDHALGEVPCTQLSEASWTRTVGGRYFREKGLKYDNTAFLPAIDLETRNAQSRVLHTFRRSNRLSGEREIFDLVEYRRRAGEISDAGVKNLCAELLEERRSYLRKKGWLSPGKDKLLAWCVQRLTFRKSLGGLRGLKPITVKLGLAVAVHEIFGPIVTKGDFDFDRAQLRAAATDALSKTSVKRLVRSTFRDLDRFLSNPKALPSSDKQRNGARSDYSTDFVEERNPQPYVSAHVMVERDYRALLDRFADFEGARELRLITMLAYRAGLRIWEIMGLRTSDVIVAGDHIELQVTHTVQRRLKTEFSQRILPLHVLLSPEERTALLRWLDDRRALQQLILNADDIFRPKEKANAAPVEKSKNAALPLEATERVRSVSAIAIDRLFGAPFTRALIDTQAVEAKINQAIASLEGYEFGSFGWLRHSFSSLLLLKLVLPHDASVAQLPPLLFQSMAWPDRMALKKAFFGNERLGHSALHAVSQAMGHSAIGQTLHTYQHLLDVLVASYANRQGECTAHVPLGEMPREPAALGRTQNSNDNLPPSEYVPKRHRGRGPKPRWKGVLKSVHADGSLGPIATFTSANENDALDRFSEKRVTRVPWPVVLLCLNGTNVPDNILANHGITEKQAKSWRSKALKHYRRYFMISGQSLRFTVPHGAVAQYELNRLWARFGNRDRPLTKDERSALGNFVHNFVSRRGFARLSSEAEAILVKKLLVNFGVPQEHITVEKSGEICGRVYLSVRKTDWDALGWTSSIKTRTSRPVKVSKGQTPNGEARRTYGDGHVYGRNPNHHFLVHAYKLFLLMLVLVEDIKGKDAIHAQSKAVPKSNSKKKRRSKATAKPMREMAAT